MENIQTTEQNGTKQNNNNKQGNNPDVSWIKFVYVLTTERNIDVRQLQNLVIINNICNYSSTSSHSNLHHSNELI